MKAAASTASDPKSQQSAPVAQSEGGPVRLVPTLLNVEDFEPARFLRTNLFRAAGFDVVEAASAGEALEAATRRRLSVALVDANLPDSSGIALCDTLRRLNPGLPVLLISAAPFSPEAQEAGMAAGAQAYLREPVGSDVLVRSVSRVLGDVATAVECETWVVTDAQGFILHASPLGARLLSGTPRGLQQRSLIVFFEQDRDAWRDAMTRAARGERVFRSGRLRPKERRPITVSVEIEKSDEMPMSLLWSFRPGSSD